LIVHSVFLNTHRTINRQGWLTLSDNAPMDEWAHWRAEDSPDWGDLRFPRTRLEEELNPIKPGRELLPIPEPPSPKPARSRHRGRNRPGPPPIKMQAITQRMIVDYAGRPDALECEKEATLVSIYQDVGGGGEPSRDTVRKARASALVQLRQNSDSTPIIDK
jgi:hypothetical protein